jgi:hypothetical protein
MRDGRAPSYAVAKSSGAAARVFTDGRARRSPHHSQVVPQRAQQLPVWQYERPSWHLATHRPARSDDAYLAILVSLSSDVHQVSRPVGWSGQWTRARGSAGSLPDGCSGDPAATCPPNIRAGASRDPIPEGLVGVWQDDLEPDRGMTGQIQPWDPRRKSGQGNEVPRVRPRARLPPSPSPGVDFMTA